MHVCTFDGPRGQPMHCEGMPELVRSGARTPTRWLKAQIPQQASQRIGRCAQGESRSIATDEQRHGIVRTACRQYLLAVPNVLPQFRGKIVADR